MITINGKQFEPFIHHGQIAEKVAALAERLNADYAGKNPILIAILNGAFIFAADLVRHLTFDHEIQFAKFSSYHGHHDVQPFALTEGEGCQVGRNRRPVDEAGQTDSAA